MEKCHRRYQISDVQKRATLFDNVRLHALLFIVVNIHWIYNEIGTMLLFSFFFIKWSYNVKSWNMSCTNTHYLHRSLWVSHYFNTYYISTSFLCIIISILKIFLILLFLYMFILYFTLIRYFIHFKISFERWWMDSYEV